VPCGEHLTVPVGTPGEPAPPSKLSDVHESGWDPARPLLVATTLAAASVGLVPHIHFLGSVVLAICLIATVLVVGTARRAMSGHPSARATWLLTVALLGIGLVSCAVHIWRDLLDERWYLLVPMVIGYLVLGWLAVLRGPAFWVFLLAHAVLIVLALHQVHPNIDVHVILDHTSHALLHGHNPYGLTYPDTYSPAQTARFYDASLVGHGRILAGFPYLPGVLVGYLPGYLLGDVRYSSLIALAIVTVLARRMAHDRTGRALALTAVAGPTSVTLITNYWVEPIAVLGLALLVWAMWRGRALAAAIGLALFVTAKQYVVVCLPLVGLVWRRPGRWSVLLGVGAAAATLVGFFVADPSSFTDSVVGLQLKQPVRGDSTSLAVDLVTAFGAWPDPLYGLLPILAGLAVALVVVTRGPGGATGVCVGVGLSLLATVLLSKQAFTNYYALIAVATALGAVLWRPEVREPTPDTTSWQTETESPRMR
jgi:hypothetical protein